MSCASIAISKTSVAFEVTRKRRKSFPSETRVKRGRRFVHGDVELTEKLGRNDLCPCGSGRRFQGVLPRLRPPRRRQPAALLSGSDRWWPGWRREAPQSGSGGPGFRWRSIRATNVLDAVGRLSGVRKLKLKNCAPILGRPAIGFFMRQSVAPGTGNPCRVWLLQSHRARACETSHSITRVTCFFPANNKLTSVRCGAAETTGPPDSAWLRRHAGGGPLFTDCYYQ